MRIGFWYSFFRLYKNGRFTSLVKAIACEYGKKVYLGPIGIFPPKG